MSFFMILVVYGITLGKTDFLIYYTAFALLFESTFWHILFEMSIICVDICLCRILNVLYNV